MNMYLMKNRKRLRRFWVCMILISILIVPITGYSAKNTQAFNIRIENVIGKGTSVLNIAGKKLSARKKMKLYSGYKVTTSRKNYVYMSMDSSKAIKQDQNSKVQLKKQGNKNEIYVLKGKIFFNVNKNLKSNETMNVKTSNVSMGIRGTSGVIAVEPIFDDNQRLTEVVYYIQIYDGTGYIEYDKNDGSGTQDASLKAGYQLIIRREIEETGKSKVSIEKIGANDIPSFAIEELLNNKQLLEKVLEETKLTETELKEALKKNKEKEEKKEEQQNKVIEEIKDKIAKNETIIYEDENSPSEGSSSQTTPSTPDPNEYGFNIDNLPGGKLSQQDLEKVFSAHPTVRLTTQDTQKTVELSGEITIKEKNSLVVDEKVTLNNPEGNTFNNNGKITNYGTNSIHNYGTIHNTGIIVNAGSVYNEPGSILRNTGTMENSGEIDNQGQMHFDGGKIVNSGIISNKRGAYFTEQESVIYENSGSMRMFSGVDLENETKIPWEAWRAVSFLGYDGITLIKEAYSKINDLPVPPEEIMTDVDFTGWNMSYEGEEDMEVEATRGALMKLDYKGMVIGCNNFNEIDEKVGIDSIVNVTLLRDYTMPEVLEEQNQVVFTNRNEISIDLNGYTISTTGYQSFRNKGNLTIKNSQDEGGIYGVFKGDVGSSSPSPSPDPNPMPYTDNLFINDSPKDEGSFILENVKITISSELSSSDGQYVFENLNEGNMLLKNCRLELNGEGNVIGIKNHAGWIELDNTEIFANIEHMKVIELGEDSPEGALRASNSRLIGAADYIIGIWIKNGHENRIVGGENVMTFELNSTGVKIGYY